MVDINVSHSFFDLLTTLPRHAVAGRKISFLSDGCKRRGMTGYVDQRRRLYYFSMSRSSSVHAATENRVLPLLITVGRFPLTSSSFTR